MPSFGKGTVYVLRLAVMTAAGRLWTCPVPRKVWLLRRLADHAVPGICCKALIPTAAIFF